MNRKNTIRYLITSTVYTINLLKTRALSFILPLAGDILHEKEISLTNSNNCFLCTLYGTLFYFT